MEMSSQKNIERYHKMLVNPRDEDQRRIILRLLAEEEAKLREFASHGFDAAENSGAKYLSG